MCGNHSQFKCTECLLQHLADRKTDHPKACFTFWLILIYKTDVIFRNFQTEHNYSRFENNKNEKMGMKIN